MLETYANRFISIMDDSSIDILEKENRLQLLMEDWNNVLFDYAINKKEKLFASAIDYEVYEPEKSYERSVQFTFGQMTFYRKSYRKYGRIIYPIDQWFELDQYQRYSEKVKFVATKLSGITTYRNVSTIFSDLTSLSVSKDTVMRLVKRFGDNVKETAKYYKKNPLINESIKRKKVPFLFVEGDGIIVSDKNGSNKEISCFVIHEGVKENGKRKETINRRFIVNPTYSTSVKEATDYIYTNYDLTDTIVITNGDGGKGYTKNAFQTIVGLAKQVEYFIDRYHVTKKLNERVFVPELIDLFQEAINEHSLKKLKLALDTLKSNCLNEEQEFHCAKLKSYLSRNWEHLRSLKDRKIDLKKEGIGIMESQLRSIAYRMKRQGKYWGKGLFGMLKIIENTKNYSMKSAFLCEWKHDWDLADELENYYIYVDRKPKRELTKVSYVNRYSLDISKVFRTKSRLMLDQY